jgi:hypothetical protein
MFADFTVRDLLLKLLELCDLFTGLREFISVPFVRVVRFCRVLLSTVL